MRVYAEAAKGQEREGTESAATRVTPGERGEEGDDVFRCDSEMRY